MKKIVMFLITFLTLAGMMKADVIKSNNLGFAPNFADIFGHAPKYIFEVGGGYGWSQAAESWGEYDPSNQGAVLYGQYFGQYEHVDNTSSGGILANLKVNITDKIWLGSNYTFGSATQHWYKDAFYDAMHNYSPYYNFGTITINTSPEVSLNYAPINLWGFKPYIGGAWEYVSVSGQYHVYNGPVTTSVNGGGSNWLVRLGLIFPTGWSRLTGEVTWEKGGVGLSTPVMNDFETVKTAGFDSSHLSASFNLGIW